MNQYSRLSRSSCFSLSRWRRCRIPSLSGFGFRPSRQESTQTAEFGYTFVSVEPPISWVAGCVEALLRFLSRCSLSLCVSKSQVRRRRTACALIWPGKSGQALLPPADASVFVWANHWSPISHLAWWHGGPSLLLFPAPKMCGSGWQPFSFVVGRASCNRPAPAMLCERGELFFCQPRKTRITTTADKESSPSLPPPGRCVR